MSWQNGRLSSRLSGSVSLLRQQAAVLLSGCLAPLRANRGIQTQLHRLIAIISFSIITLSGWTSHALCRTTGTTACLTDHHHVLYLLDRLLLLQVGHLEPFQELLLVSFELSDLAVPFTDHSDLLPDRVVLLLADSGALDGSKE